MEITELKINKDVVSKTVQGEQILLNLKTGFYFGLDPVGTDIWTLIESNTDQLTIINTICDNYDVEATTAEAHLKRLIEELKNNELLQ